MTSTNVSSVPLIFNATFTALLGENSPILAKALAIINRPTGEKIPLEDLDSYGHHWEALYALYPTFFFIFMFFALRTVCKFYVFPPLARSLGIKSKKVIPKFSYQCWLLIFYTTSTLYGHLTLHDKPWVSYPLGQSQIDAISDQWRTAGQVEIAWYYSYQIGFFVAELYAIFTEPKRSDFFEYLMHHIVTLYLIIFSWAGSEYRIGSYVLIIHDVVDIFLCLAKITNYLKVHDIIMIPVFGTFVASYAFFRMYCLPVLSIGLFKTTLPNHPAVASECLLYILAFALQALHVFWFFLILRVIYRIAFQGVKNDVRSDNEDTDEEADASKLSPTKKKHASPKAVENKKKAKKE